MGHRFTSTALAALMLGVATPVIAQSTEAVRTFSIGAGPLERSLPVFAQQSGLQILYPSALVTGRQARALTGEYTPEAALAELLRGTGLAYRQSRPTVFVLVDPSARAEAEPQATQLEEIVVTGTYLRGADPALAGGRFGRDRPGPVPDARPEADLAHAVRPDPRRPRLGARPRPDPVAPVRRRSSWLTNV